MAERSAKLEAGGSQPETGRNWQELDNAWLHPWEDMRMLGGNRRTVIERSEGIYVHDTDGNCLIDGPAGMWCVNVGHGRKEIAEAMYAQALRMPYYSPWGLSNEPAAELSERLAAIAPGDLDHVFFTTGGSTAVDSAFRFVMFYNNILGRPEKKKIISREYAYHGSTYLAASASGKERDKNFLDFATDIVHHIPVPNPYRRPASQSLHEFLEARIADLEDKILELGPEHVAAFVAEPVLASGGVIVPPPGYHERCLEVCRKYDVLYISDEVVTGFGRLGHWFASEPVFDIVPDIITCAKGLTSGYAPLGALVISDRLLSQLGKDASKRAVFSNGFTYSGHPVSCAAALASMDIIEREGLLQHVRDLAPYFQKRLRELLEIPIVCDVRGEGLMAGVECDITDDRRNALALDAEIGAIIDKHCQKLGLMVRPLYHMCVLSPPLVITRGQVDDLVDRLRQGITLAMEEAQVRGLWKG